MDNCTLCPRMCGAHRPLTGKGDGFCTLPALPGICRAEKHMWEEPDISGEKGSGTVFFSGCVLRCEFCQNSVISRQSCGKTVNAQELAKIFRRLESEGVHNINLVSPTPYYPVITEALDIYRPGIRATKRKSCHRLRRLCGAPRRRRVCVSAGCDGG